MAVATARQTEASARFMNALVALEKETEDSGIYVNKPGYHGTLAENLARNPRDYSVQHPLDKTGPRDKGRAYDWTHRKAQRGDYSSMAKYGDRLEKFFLARDPRFYGWREALGQTDTDKAAEALDFDGWFRRVPDSTHEWHWHFSEHTAFVADWDNKLCMLSMLQDQSLEDYLSAGGKLMKGAAVGIREDLTQDCVPNRWWRDDAATNPTVQYQFWMTQVWDHSHGAAVDAAAAKNDAAALRTEISVVKSELAAIKALIPAAGGGGIDPAALAQLVQAAVRDGLGDALRAGGQAIDPS